MVESQEQVATTRLVDSLDKQRVLEDLLEATKPPARPARKSLHYLLATPFRYPPLRHGSRFGTRLRPGILYGSVGLSTLLAEVAYYRFVFWSGMTSPPPARLTTQHTVFEARYRTAAGVRLQRPPFDEYRRRLRNPADYRDTQQLGESMRDAGVQAFEYVSARDPGQGINVGLLTPEALARGRPDRTEPWVAETDEAHVRFSGGDERSLLVFPRELFLTEGRLPAPAV